VSATDAILSAERVIELLGLEPHPEGGHFTETFRDAVAEGARAAGSAIYYLLRAGEESVWHRVHDAAEVWLWYAGAPLSLLVAAPGRPAETLQLGTDIQSGERPQAIVPAGHWQSARSTGNWTLVGCTVSPAFEFGSFEMAPAGWSPPGK
jgi:predicted cupin superfamily sugar epimerase